MTAIAWALIALGVVALVLTQVRLRKYGGRQGMPDIAPWILNVHSVAGAIGLAVVALRLLDVLTSGAAMWVSIAALALASLVGLSFLGRWRRARGRHVEQVTGDGWTSGPWLSQIAHFGVTVGSLFLAWGMLSGRF